MNLTSIRTELKNEFSVSPEALAAEVEEILALLISERLLIPPEP